MLVAQKIDKIKFSKDNYKDSYLKAVKFASMLISSERKLCFRYEKDLEDKKSIYLTIMFLYDESELSSHRCKVCQEFHHSFFINDETNCNNNDICKNKFINRIKQFDSFFKKFFSDENMYLILNVCDYEIDLKLEDIEKAANGDVNAIDRLGIAASKDILINLDFKNEKVKDKVMNLHD